MKANISEDELKLLAYLHEHARGFNKHFHIEAKALLADLSLTDDQLKCHSSYLEAHGLAGVTASFVGSLGDQHPIIRGIWITGLGEDYMRELEDSPTVSRKLTAGVVTETWGVLKAVAAKVLGDLIVGRM